MSPREVKGRKRGRQGDYDGPRCGAKTRTPEKKGRGCRKPAGWGTGHLGYGPCRLHGGSTRSHVAKAMVEQMRDEMPVPLLVRQVDRDAIRGVVLAVINGLDLDVAQQIHARELLDHEIAGLSAPITAKEARRIARQARADAERQAIEREEEQLDELTERRVIRRRRKQTNRKEDS